MSEQKFIRRPVIDPAVAELLAGMEHKQAISQLPRRKREKYAREHAKIEARRDQRVTYDLPRLLKDKIREMAEEHNLPASQLAALALIRFLDDMSRGKIDLESMKEPSRSPRYDWNLKLPSGPIYIENIRDKR
jgi:hypothetical protein